ncbi:unnamed protein product [Bursaphelenchus okinawaensis]|uniref:F-box domain-containing protein n=1 Tax=Bursaphelenchus okinawaensis TaxID=465554 RepID=A0A811L245_9BILA|nr:unnamed protein product [Bursaphelenchus okinawaensis]CAG9114743.1 unnamed protein product [Bursaphelenchus okinawaensis]
MEKIGKLNQDIWDIIIKHSELTSVTNLARAGRRFNNYVGLDFHKLCVVNHIFRLPGESWADAFADGIWNRAASSVQRPRCTLPKDIAPNFIVYEASVVAKADLKRARKVVSTSQNVGINQGKEKRPLYNKNTKIYVDKQEGLATNDGEQQSLVLTERDNRDSYPDEKQDRWMTYKCSFLEEKSRSQENLQFFHLSTSYTVFEDFGKRSEINPKKKINDKKKKATGSVNKLQTYDAVCDRTADCVSPDVKSGHDLRFNQNQRNPVKKYLLHSTACTRSSDSRSVRKPASPTCTRSSSGPTNPLQDIGYSKKPKKRKTASGDRSQIKSTTGKYR